MSLEDKFYPEDGSLINTLDNFLIKSAGKVGELYQHTTGNSYKELVKGSYKAAITCSFIAAPFTCGSALLLSFFPAVGYYHPSFCSPIEDEIKEEAKGGPKKGPKYLRLLWLSSSVAMFNFGKFIFNETTQSGDYLGILYGTSTLIGCSSLIPYTFAEYLSKADIPEPPKKTVLQKAKDKLNELFVPVPTPQPVSVKSYNLQ